MSVLPHPGRRFWTIAGTCVVAWLVFAPQAAASTSCSWEVVATPNVGSSDNELTAISHVAGTKTRMWAVGSYFDPADGHRRNLVMRWDGNRWIVVPTPNFGSGDDVLTGVVALSSFNIWVVGYFEGVDGTRHTVAMRSNGKRWTRLPTPNPGAGDDVLLAVDAVSPRNVWAVGYSRRGDDTEQTLAMRWDGKRWKWVRTPNVRSGDERLLDVGVIPGTRQIWAVGWADELDGGRELALRRHEGRWRVFTGPVDEGTYGVYRGVAAVSAERAFAVGSWETIGDGVYPAIASWSRREWSFIEADIGEGESALFGVTARSVREAWAVGMTSFGTSPETLVARWNGSQWSRVASPNPGTNWNLLSAVTHAPRTDRVWAVGSYRRGEDAPLRTLALRYCSEGAAQRAQVSARNTVASRQT